MDFSKPTDAIQKSPPPDGGQQQPPICMPVSPPRNYQLTDNVQPPPPPPPPALQVHGGAPGPWSTGLCGCCSDVRNCCITCWCPCITFGQVAEIVDRGSTSCGVSGALYALIALITGCSCIYSCFYRSKMRKQYMLQKSPCGDCLVHFCCELCALCQEYRELKHRGFDMSLGWQGNVDMQNQGVTTAPYVQGGMTR